MNEIVVFLAAPFVACLVLVGIHAYLGIHVIARGVVFVDLALAQVAALGATAAFLLGYPLGGGVAYAMSLAFTLVGAAVFAVARRVEGRVPQEAIIGIVYAAASAAAILVVDKAPHGAEHIRQMLVGDILWVQWPKVLHTAGIYALVGIFHWVFRKRFLDISFRSEAAEREGGNVVFWDFLFYTSFGFVVTSSVQIAGVLLVFTFLVVPAVASVLWTEDLRVRLAFGYVFGALASLLGIASSWWLDVPAGAAVAVAFALALAVVALLARSSARAGA